MSGAEPEMSEATQAPRSTRRFSRRVAFMVLVAIVGVLSLGWLADTLGQFAPRTTFTNGETQQAGLYRVALTFEPGQTRAGDATTVTARIQDSAGQPASDVGVRLVMSMPTM